MDGGNGQIVPASQLDLGAQPIQAQSAHEIVEARRLSVEEKRAAGHLGDKEIVQVLALRSQEGSPDRPTRRNRRHIVGNQALEKGPGIRAAHSDDAALVQQGIE